MAAFLEMFQKHKGSIRNFEGCRHLELLRDAHEPDTYVTLSYWENAERLEGYRNSALFKMVWGSTKVLFSAPPEAFSVEKFIEV